LRNVLLKIMNVVSVFIIVFSIMALLTVVMAKPGEAPNFFGYSFFRVMTGSMEPTISTDSLIVVKRVKAEKLREGDVITFYSRDPALMGEPNTHRIIRFEEEGGKKLIYTKGDANNVEDRYPSEESDVIGKVVFSSSKVGKFVRLVSNPLIFIPLIVIPLVFMLGQSVFDGIKAAKKLAKEEEEAAVREALAELRKKRQAEAGAGANETDEELTEVGEADKESKDTCEAGEKAEAQEVCVNAPTAVNQLKKERTNEKAFGTCNEVWRLEKNWRGRYGVQHRGYKRNQINRGKRKR